MSVSDQELQDQFDALSSSSVGKESVLPLAEVKEWLAQACVMGKATGITDADVDNAFSKSAKDKGEMNFTEFMEFILTLASNKGINASELVDKFGTGKPEEKAGDTAKVPGGCS